MSASVWLIRGGRVVDPASGRDGVADVLVRNGRVEAIGQVPSAPGARVLDAAGLIVAPGLIDVHVHLREPGFETKETIATGTAAAAAGGFTTIFCMPNTRPALDSAAALRDLKERVTRDGCVRVYPIATITKGRAGREAVDFAALAEAGAVGFSDDGDTTRDSGIMRRALEASVELGRPIMAHCEDKGLANGSMHEGDVSERLRLPGIPAAAEEIVVARDLMLAGLTAGWLHVCHVSTGGGAELIRAARASGAHVTAEVTPHHLLMSDEWVAGDRTLVNVDEPAGCPGTAADPDTKVNPPLRPAADAHALLAALRNGTIDIVATDHAPHAAAEKQGSSFESAAFGMSGLEFALPLMLELVRAGRLALADVITALSWPPARLWGLNGGSLAPGQVGDLVVIDPEEQWGVSASILKSKSANTPLLGMELRGRVKLTLVGGEERHASW